MKYIITTLLTILLSVTYTHAQSVGDKLYNQGIALQKKKNKQSQRQAIDKFNAAKIAYDSAAKKSKCDAAIATSNRIIESLSSTERKDTDNSKRKKDRHNDNNYTEPANATLEVDINRLLFRSSSKPGHIKVTTNQRRWNVHLASQSAADFVTLRKDEDNTGFYIICLDNKTYSHRTATIVVTAGNMVRHVNIEQTGIDMKFYAENTAVECSRKGGKKSIFIYSNCKIPYSDNNNKNWHVVSKPEWIDVISGDKKNDNIFKKIGNAVQGISNIPDSNNSLQTSVANFIIMSIPKDAPEYKTGRKGEVILESGASQIKILLLQQ